MTRDAPVFEWESKRARFNPKKTTDGNGGGQGGGLLPPWQLVFPGFSNMNFFVQ